MTEIEEIYKDREETIFKITTKDYVPFYVRLSGYKMHIIQPIFQAGEEFDRKKCFETENPKELVFYKEEFAEFMSALNKIMMIDRLGDGKYEKN